MLNLLNLNTIRNLVKDKTLIAVTKYVGDNEIKALLAEGIYNLGENRANIFLEKVQKYQNLGIHWHFIGHLQSNKVKSMINHVDVLHSLDRISLAKEIQKHREEVLPCFIEVNISGEPSKHGLKPENVKTFYNKLIDYDKIQVIGFMGMAKHTGDALLIKQNFEILVKLKSEFDALLSMEHKLSMGMSNDYKIALEMGSTHLRIGSILFEEET